MSKKYLKCDTMNEPVLYFKYYAVKFGLPCITTISENVATNVYCNSDFDVFAKYDNQNSIAT